MNSGGNYWRELQSGYDTEREDWNLKVTGSENRHYWIAPDGKLFDDQASAESHATILLSAAKKSEYALMNLQSANSGNLQLINDVAANVKQVAIPVNEFSVKGSETEGTVFFDPDAMDYRLVAASQGGSIVSGPYVKGNSQLFKPDDNLAKAKDVILHEGRYFLVQDPAGIDKENLSKIVESFPPSGTVVSYSGQLQQFDSTNPPTTNTNLSAGQHFGFCHKAVLLGQSESFIQCHRSSSGNNERQFRCYGIESGSIHCHACHRQCFSLWIVSYSAGDIVKASPYEPNHTLQQTIPSANDDSNTEITFAEAKNLGSNNDGETIKVVKSASGLPSYFK